MNSEELRVCLEHWTQWARARGATWPQVEAGCVDILQRADDGDTVDDLPSWPALLAVVCPQPVRQEAHRVVC